MNICSTSQNAPPLDMPAVGAHILVLICSDHATFPACRQGHVLLADSHCRTWAHLCMLSLLRGRPAPCSCAKSPYPSSVRRHIPHLSTAVEIHFRMGLIAAMEVQMPQFKEELPHSTPVLDSPTHTLHSVCINDHLHLEAQKHMRSPCFSCKATHPRCWCPSLVLDRHRRLVCGCNKTTGDRNVLVWFSNLVTLLPSGSVWTYASACVYFVLLYP